MNKISSINKLLIKKFGIPPRAKDLPKPIDLLIATILSQNTNDKNSYRAFLNLKLTYKNWEDVKNSEIKLIEDTIKIAGLGFQKANAIKNLLEELFKHEGNFDLENLQKFDENDSINYLTNFKGIGVKTASCVLLFSLDKNICPVDTHVHRTLNRIGIVQTNSPEKTFYQINTNLPKGIAHALHTNLIRLGREICKPKNYKCSICPIEKICEFTQKNFELIENSKQNNFMLLDNV
ncbi:MAG: endonuclease III [Melioribacteraceae bacterium]